MKEEALKPKVCRLDWTAKKIKKIIAEFANQPKDEKTKKEHSELEEFLEHCSIPGEILAIVISTIESNNNYLPKVLVNQTLTKTQIIALFEEVKKYPHLLENSEINTSFATHPNSPKYIERLVS